MTRRLTFIALTVALAVAGFSEGSGQRGQNPTQVEPLPEVPPHLQFVPLAVAERMLDLASVTSSDVVYDLGCGDGRLAIVAAKKFGARAVGVDVDAKRIAEAAANAAQAGVSTLVRFERQPTIDLSEATVLTMSIPAVGGVADPEWTAASGADETVEGRLAHRHEFRRRFDEGVETRSGRPLRRRARKRACDPLHVEGRGEPVEVLRIADCGLDCGL